MRYYLLINRLRIAGIHKRDNNQLSPKVTLNVRMCCRVRNQLGKAFELNVKKSCNLISINNLEECVDNKQMVCKKFGKVDLCSKNLAFF